MEHIIIISKLKPEALSLVTQMAERGCVPQVILLSEAVYLLTRQGEHLDEVNKAIKFGATFFAPSEEISKRGIEILEDVIQINYSTLVDLLLEKPERIINL